MLLLLTVRVTGEPPFSSMTKVSPGAKPKKDKPNSCSEGPPLEPPELLEATFPPLVECAPEEELEVDEEVDEPPPDEPAPAVLPPVDPFVGFENALEPLPPQALNAASSARPPASRNPSRPVRSFDDCISCPGAIDRLK